MAFVKFYYVIYYVFTSYVYVLRIIFTYYVFYFYYVTTLIRWQIILQSKVNTQFFYERFIDSGVNRQGFIFRYCFDLLYFKERLRSPALEHCNKIQSTNYKVQQVQQSTTKYNQVQTRYKVTENKDVQKIEVGLNFEYSIISNYCAKNVASIALIIMMFCVLSYAVKWSFFCKCALQYS